MIRVGGGITNRSEKVRPVTEKGLESIQFVRQFKEMGNLKTMCWGNRRPIRIVEFTEPAASDGVTVTRAKFEYRIVPMDWVTPAILEKIGVDPEKVESGMAGLVETSKGWRVDRISW